MKAIVIKNYGGPEVLTVGEVPVPKLENDEVLIKVRAAGVNRLDILQRKGKYPPPKKASEILGVEVAGIIVAIGDEVTQHKVGDSVCALVAGGGYAEYCSAPALQAMKIPKEFSYVQAASIPETYFTVWSNLFQDHLLKKGMTFLVHGGSSGIGTTAIQLAYAYGCKVFTTAGSDEKCRRCKSLGAESAINYQTENFVDRILRVTSGSGVDVILDMVGGDYIQKNIDCMSYGGVLINIGFQKGAFAEVNFSTIISKSQTIKGSALRTRSIAEKGKIAEELSHYVWPLFENKAIKPIIDSTFPLSDVVQAHERMESREHFGKIVMTL